MATPERTLLAARQAVRPVLHACDEVLVAVSGGADSLALAAAVALEAGPANCSARAVVVDHQLQEGSAEVAARAAAQVEALGLPAELVQVDVGSEGGLEAAAREARRAALLAAAGPTTPVLLAHTRNDQAESVLLGLGRGSGMRSIRGMRPVDGQWHRPFLDMTREQTETICAHLGLEWWNDPHNTDPAFRRVRIRHEVLPLLDEVLGGGVIAALARTAEQLDRDNDALDELAAAQLTADVTRLAELHEAIRLRVLRLLALEAGALPGELRATHLNEMDRLITAWRGQARIELPGHISVSRQGNRLIFITTPVAP